jgi:hypothetical protein
MKDFLEGRTAAANLRQGKKSPLPASSLPSLSSLQDVSIVQENGAIDSPAPAESFSPPTEIPVNPEPPAAAEPQIELVHDAQGRIGHIIVTCSCGEKIILQCNY